MRIGIDISQVVYRGTGVARFTEGLIDAILDYGHEHSWVFFYSSLRNTLPQSIEKDIIASGLHLVHIPLPPRFLSYLWNDVHIASPEYVMGTLDWFISSDWTQPPIKSKKATIVHDLAFKRFPDTIHPRILAVQEKRLRWVSKEADLIFCDSEATKNDLIHFYDLKDSQVITNYPGLKTYKLNKKMSTVRESFGIHKPFILSVGKHEPRKNFNRLISAFHEINTGKYQLVIAGPQGWADTKIDKDIIVTGYVTDEVLSDLYKNCVYFVYPSLWEGFGYPVAEAMTFGKAVITSETSSLKEIAGTAALLCDPQNQKDISNKMKELMSNSHLRHQLEEAGKKRSTLFNWKSYYKIMIESLTNYQ